MKKIEKILEYLDNENISLSEFERKSGISNAYLKNTFDRGADVTQKILDKIKSNNPETYHKIFKIEEELLAVANEPVEKFAIPTKEKLLDHEALLSVLVSRVAALQASVSGEDPAVITKSIYKAAENLRKLD